MPIRANRPARIQASIAARRASGDDCCPTAAAVNASQTRIIPALL